ISREELSASAAIQLEALRTSEDQMNAAEKIEPQTEPHHAIVPLDLVHRAITSGADVVVLEKLMALQERWEAGQARKAFDAAMAAAKAEIPVILKTRKVDFTSGKGRTQYRYEDLAEIARTVDPVLGKFGLSYRWRTAALTPDTIAVTCIVSHRDGHSEETTVPGNHDGSGNKNSIQAVGSAITYLQRYTLRAALGLAAPGDDDGQASGKPPAGTSENKVPSSEDYVERGAMFLEDADTADEVIKRGKDEGLYRNRFTWPDHSQATRLALLVT